MNIYKPTYIEVKAQMIKSLYLQVLAFIPTLTTMNIPLIIVLLTLSQILFAQQTMYVNADQGLIIRKQPNKNAQRIGKLAYGTEVQVLKATRFELTIKDGQKSVNGRWVEVQATQGHPKGYVFDGYLTYDRLNKRIEIKFEDFSLQISLEIWGEKKVLNKIHTNTAEVGVSLGSRTEGKKVKVKHTKFKKIEVFQRYENSVTIMNQGPHCDLRQWKHYYSDWKKLNYNTKENTFITAIYKDADSEKFIPVNINDLKSAVKKKCGKYWSKLIKNIRNVNEYPSAVTMSKIYLKIVLTDKNGRITQKMVEFIIPMGC